MYCQSERIDITRQLILRCMGLIYTMSFTSWYYQISELYGPNGLLPISILNRDELPFTLLKYGLNETTLSILCIAGALLGLAVFCLEKCANLFNLALLWILYLSLYHVGQDFASFQWDILLLEAGFIAIIMTTFEVAGRELFRWLAFRLYFASGVLKLLSQCPTWWNLTALNYHFSSQCLPHYLSWWAHQLPDEAKKVLVAGNFFILIVGSLCLYMPIRVFRIYGFVLQVIMQVSIMLTGNYNYFNFLSIVITLSAIDDQFIINRFPAYVLRFLNVKVNIQNTRIDIFNIGICLYMTMSVLWIFVPYTTIIKNENLPYTVEELSKYLLSENNFYYFINYVIAFFFAYITYFNVQQARISKLSNLLKILKSIMQIMIFLSMFSLSNYIFQRGLGIKQTYSPIVGQESVNKFHTYVSEYNLVGSYGLFRRMTGVNGRPELIFEGSMDGKSWQEYQFHYKPGALNAIPQIMIPHQPRLEWQLWFAAFGEHPQDKYLVHLVYKILAGNMKSLKEHYKQPKYIRIQKYLYYFTTMEEMLQSGNYWKRTFKQSYLPQISLDDAQLRQLSEQFKFIGGVQSEQLVDIPLMLIVVIILISRLLII